MSQRPFKYTPDLMFHITYVRAILLRKQGFFSHNNTTSLYISKPHKIYVLQMKTGQYVIYISFIYVEMIPSPFKRPDSKFSRVQCGQ